MDAKRAGEYLKDIHTIMERSAKHSTLSGLSGIVAGAAAVAGAVLSKLVYNLDPYEVGWMNAHRDETFLCIWMAVAMVAVVADVIFTKRKARNIGKQFFDRPMRRVLVAFIPGIVCGVALTEYFYEINSVRMLPMYWMLFYGLALISASTISLRELFVMGAGFIIAGIVTMFALADHPMLMMGISFGGFHLVYGIYMWVRHGG